MILHKSKNYTMAYCHGITVHCVSEDQAQTLWDAALEATDEEVRALPLKEYKCADNGGFLIGCCRICGKVPDVG